MKFCVKCGKEMSDTAKFCPDCGMDQPMQETLKKESPYPIEYRIYQTNNRKIIGFSLLVVLSLWVVITQIANSQEKFYDYVTHEVVMPGFQPFFLILFIILLILSVVLLVKTLKSRSVAVYIVTCPYCGEQTIFPVGVQGYDCDICHKRIIMKNNQVQKTSN